jgi:hypothetical protein
MLEVLIDPEHVVSVPTDCSQQKIRVCEMYISAICERQTKSFVHVPQTTPETVKKKATAAKKTKEDAKKTPVQTTSNEPAVTAATSGVKIGVRFYSRKLITRAILEEAQKDGYKKLVKSDFPAFFSRLAVKEVYRKKDGKSFDYIAGQNSAYMMYNVVVPS